MKKVEFTVMGEAVGKGRPKFSTVNGYARAYTPEKTTNYEGLINREYIRQTGGYSFGNAEINVEITADMAIPKSTSMKKKAMMLSGEIRPTKKPDVDNIAKIVLDALNKTAFDDDKNVVSCTVNKYYSENPCVTVCISSVNAHGNEIILPKPNGLKNGI